MSTSTAPKSPIPPLSISSESKIAIEELRDIADSRWCWQPPNSVPHWDAGSIVHDAESITKLVMTSSLVARDPSSARIERFAERYREHVALDMNTIGFDEITDILYEYFERIDVLFFFKLLTREIQGVSGRRNLVILRTSEIPNASVVGVYKEVHDYIEIRLNRYSVSDTYTLEHFICCLVHEMVHAYMSIFADRRHKKHDKWEADHGGHGTMFWMLQSYILNHIVGFTGSDRLWEEFFGEDEARRACSRKPRCKVLFERMVRRIVE
jgi:hypothetical protein